ncbi:MAG: SMP-30/gluconolactonase/LRE family protein [Polyangiaceae bacterium]
MAILALSGILASAACSDDAASSSTGGTGGSDAIGGSSATGGSPGSGGGAAGGGGAAAVTAEVVVAFDPTAGELPEGLSVSGGEALLGMATTSRVERLTLASGDRELLATLPVPPPNAGFMTGVEKGPDGRIYAALVSFAPMPTAGVYLVEGGAASLFASGSQMVFPNGLTWDASGTLYVSDSVAGTVFAVDQAGVVTPWLSDPHLLPDPDTCGAAATGIQVGANGIAQASGAIYVAGNDQGVLLRVPITAGAPGTPEVVAGPDCDLAGMDGIAVASDGAVFAVLNRSDRLVRIDPSGDVTILLEGPPLDFPASVAFGASEQELYVTSFAVDGALSGGPAAPALLRVTLP